MTIEYGILAVRSRAPSVYKLLFDLKSQGIKPKVFWDDDMNGAAWNARRAWLSFQSDYGVLLQDDVIIGKGFVENVFNVIHQGRVENLCAGFIGGPIIRKAYDAGKRWLVGGNNTWGQCVIAKVGWMNEFIEWEQEYMNPEIQHDDRRITMYLTWSKQTCLVTVPTLVDHMELPSAMKNPVRPFGNHRMSHAFVGDEVLNWDRTEDNSYKVRPGSISGFGSMWAEGKP